MKLNHSYYYPGINSLKKNLLMLLPNTIIYWPLGPNKLSWRHLKHILKDKLCLENIIKITNIYIKVGYWPTHFKSSTTIIIPKPNKASYNMPKSFRLIVLLNMLDKLIEKVIGDRLQFHVISNNFIYQSQLGGLKYKSTTNTSIVLIHFICMGWVKNLSTSTLAFNIAQFFLLLNHHFLTLILRKAEFDFCIINFFSSYLIDRKTQYFWNNFSSSVFNINMGVGQGLALSPILLALYLTPFLHILENYLKNLNLQISILSFVNDGLLVAQSKSLHTLNSLLFCSYNVTSNLFLQFGFLVEHSKTEVFHFTRSQNSFNPPSLDISSIRGPILYPKDS